MLEVRAPSDGTNYLGPLKEVELGALAKKRLRSP